MVPKTNLTEELIIAYYRVPDALADIFETKLQPLLGAIAELQQASKQAYSIKTT